MSDTLLSSTVVAGISWDDVIGETAACLGGRSRPFPGLLCACVAQHLVVFFANASDDNAARDYKERRRLDRTEIAAEVERLVGMIDVESLEAAIREGVCEALDYRHR